MKNNTNRLISVIIPTFNRANLISRCIESVKSQEGDFELEIIVVDDGSTDETESIVAKYNGVKYIKIPHWGGPARPRNIGMKNAKGDYFAFLDSDDEWVAGKLQTQISVIDGSDFGVVYTNAFYIDEQNNIIKNRMLARGLGKSGLIFEDLVFSNFVPLSSVLMKKEVYKRLGNFTEDKKIGFEDYHYWLMLSANDVKFYFIDSPFMLYRTQNEKYSIKVMGDDGEDLHLRKVYRSLLGNVPSLYKNIKLSRRLLNDNSKPIKVISKLKNIRKKIINNSKASLIKLEDIKIDSNKKNVLFLIPWMTVGGADKVYLDIISNSNKKKFNFFFINLELGEKNIWKHKFEKYSKDITVLPELIDKVSYGVYLKRYIKKYNINTVITSNSLEGYILLETVKKVSKKIKTIDILHGQSGESDNGGSPAFSDNYSNYIDLRVTVTDYLNDYMQKNYRVGKSKLMTIHNGVDTKHFDQKVFKNGVFKKQYSIKSDKIISWVGRFSPEKQPLAFVEIANIISNEKKYKNISFVMAGDGILKEEIISKIDIYNLKEKITLTGFISNPALLYKDSNIVIMTSEMEGLPIVLLEAGSMGVPVVATRVGGIPEIVRNGINGFTVENDHKMPSKMASIAELILKDRILEDRLGDKNREIIVNNFNLMAMIEKYEKIM